MLLEHIDRGRIRVTLPGHTWITGEKPPEIDGYEPHWVNHIGQERTEIIFRPKGSDVAAPVVLNHDALDCVFCNGVTEHDADCER